MDWFFISPFSINVLNVSLLLTFMIYFLVRIKNKSRATRFLILSLTGVVLVFFSFFIIFSSLNPHCTTVSWCILHLVVFAFVAMVQFAYHFPENRHPRESRVVLLVCTITACAFYPYYLWKMLSMRPVYSFAGYSYVYLGNPEIAVIIGLEIFWILGIFFRKAALFSEFEYHGSLKWWSHNAGRRWGARYVAAMMARCCIAAIKTVKARDKRARAVRKLFLIFIFPIVLIATIILSYQGVLSWVISAHILGSGFMVVAFIFVIVYINNSSEPSTFMIKLVGISLGTMLIVIIMAAGIAMKVKDEAYDTRRLAEIEQCQTKIATHDLSTLPASVMYIRERTLKGGGRRDHSKVVFARLAHSALENWSPTENMAYGGEVDPVAPAAAHPPLRRYRKIDGRTREHFYIHYDLVVNDKVYEIGFDYVEYRRAIHATGVNLLLITLGAMVFITIVFPLFFRQSLVMPLKNLLDGVSKVNNGNLEVAVPIQVEDEIGFIAGSFNHMVRSIKTARHELESALDYQVKLTDSYSCFVPKEFLKFLGKQSIVDIRLGDNVQKEMTILFSDIRSFTTLSEKMTPQENFNFINSCLSRLGPVVRRNHGFIDKYIGDAVMALFPHQPRDAVAAALAMQSAIRDYNKERKKIGYQPIRIGIGVHTGVMMLGTIGEKKRMEGTVIADTVNLAARVESLTKVYDALVIVTDKTLARIPASAGFQQRFLDRVQVKGKQQWVDLFEILDCDPGRTREMKLSTRHDFEHGIALYQARQFGAAIASFRKVLAENDTDVAARLYVKRCQYFEQYGFPQGWEGVTQMHEK
jgi:class 3 adenylate cyclase/HAMP domain-containing protein